jgi:hypothetical protein
MKTSPAIQREAFEELSDLRLDLDEMMQTFIASARKTGTVPESLPKANAIDVDAIKRIRTLIAQSHL